MPLSDFYHKFDSSYPQSTSAGNMNTSGLGQGMGPRRRPFNSSASPKRRLGETWTQPYGLRNAPMFGNQSSQVTSPGNMSTTGLDQGMGPGRNKPLSRSAEAAAKRRLRETLSQPYSTQKGTMFRDQSSQAKSPTPRTVSPATEAHRKFLFGLRTRAHFGSPGLSPASRNRIPPPASRKRLGSPVRSLSPDPWTRVPSPTGTLPRRDRAPILSSFPSFSSFASLSSSSWSRGRSRLRSNSPARTMVPNSSVLTDLGRRSPVLSPVRSIVGSDNSVLTRVEGLEYDTPLARKNQFKPYKLSPTVSRDSSASNNSAPTGIAGYDIRAYYKQKYKQKYRPKKRFPRPDAPGVRSFGTASVILGNPSRTPSLERTKSIPRARSVSVPSTRTYISTPPRTLSIPRSESNDSFAAYCRETGLPDIRKGILPPSERYNKRYSPSELEKHAHCGHRNCDFKKIYIRQTSAAFNSRWGGTLPTGAVPSKTRHEECTCPKTSSGLDPKRPQHMNTWRLRMEPRVSESQGMTRILDPMAEKEYIFGPTNPEDPNSELEVVYTGEYTPSESSLIDLDDLPEGYNCPCYDEFHGLGASATIKRALRKDAELKRAFQEEATAHQNALSNTAFIYNYEKAGFKLIDELEWMDVPYSSTLHKVVELYRASNPLLDEEELLRCAEGYIFWRGDQYLQESGVLEREFKSYSRWASESNADIARNDNSGWDGSKTGDYYGGQKSSWLNRRVLWALVNKYKAEGCDFPLVEALETLEGDQSWRRYMRGDNLRSAESAAIMAMGLEPWDTYRPETMVRD